MMVSALLALLVPTAPADGVGEAPVQQVEAGKLTKAGSQSGNPAFAQMLADYQQRLEPVATAKPATVPAGGLKVAAQVSGDTSVSVQDVRLLAAQMADTKIAPQAADAMDKMEEAEEDVLPLPPIDPSNALSLIPSPIAYTTDAEVATVVVEEQLSANNPVIPEAKEAFALLADLAPAAGGQRLSFAPPPPVLPDVAMADAAEQAPLPEAPVQDIIVAQPQEKPLVLSGPEVTLPEFIPVERSDIAPVASAPERELAPAEVTTASQEVIVPLPAKSSGMNGVALEPVTPEEVEVWQMEGSSPKDEADTAGDTDMTFGASAAAMGGPLVMPEAEGDAPESMPEQAMPVSAKTPAKAPPAPAAPQGDANPDASADQNFGGASAKPQAQPASQGDMKPVGPEASVKPDAPKAEDFASLMSDKLASQQAAAAPHAVQPAQGLEHGKDVPLVKISHTHPGAPLEEQVSVHIRQAMDEGADQITIKLNPPELGKLHIKMEIGVDGRAQVLVTADNKDTFEMLQRDARNLQQALSDAGVKTDSGSLQFDLRGQSDQQAAGQFDFGGQQDQQNASSDSGGSEKIVASAAGEGDVALSLHQGEVNYTVNVSEGVDIKV